MYYNGKTYKARYVKLEIRLCSKNKVFVFFKLKYLVMILKVPKSNFRQLQTFGAQKMPSYQIPIYKYIINNILGNDKLN